MPLHTTLSRHGVGWLYALAFMMVSVCFPAVPLANAADTSLFARTNLMAWCIVPFDAQKRGPEDRARMLQRLGITQFAYDYRAEHISSFEPEIAACRSRGIHLGAWWFPGELNDEARLILSVLERTQTRAQLWVTGGGQPTRSPAEQRARVELEAKRIRPIAEAAQRIQCTVGLYNHGGWFGEPENQVQLIQHLASSSITNVGIIYNLHHGHSHLDRFPELLKTIQPHLFVFNLNGMVRDGDSVGKKILPLGQGDQDLGLLRILAASGWHGPIGILNHTDEDAEVRLQDNLDGLDWLVKQMRGIPAGPRPVPRSWREPSPIPAPNSQPIPTASPSLSPAFGNALSGGWVIPGREEYRNRPLTIECRARLHSKSGFNILVASDPKVSADHWELYSYAGSGFLSLYQPGRGGEVRSSADICDGQWHAVAAVIEPTRVRLFVDGRLVQDAPAQPLQGTPIPGGLAFGTLVEGGIGCDGLIDDVRIRRGAQEILPVATAPFTRDASTLALWNFEDLKSGTLEGTDAWAIESAEERARLPEFKVVPAAHPAALTPAVSWPDPSSRTNWHRSLGDATSSRFSALQEIHRGNVANLKVAWTYHSKDGAANIQCNPIIVEGVLYLPTAGHALAAVDGQTGAELWRFKPEANPGGQRLEDAPARRGLVYWTGDDTHEPRILFTCGNWIYSLHPKTGKPSTGFGTNGRTPLSAAGTVAGALYRHVLVVPGYQRDVFGYDVRSGELLWTFHTLPHPGEFGYETWSQVSEGANCWGGMALDESRGIAFVSTGSPKPNFIGNRHLGDNLFANCLLALDALTGKRLWHFQEVPHDIWDWDIPAPPNLVTVQRHGRSVDAVAQVTKLGNTLLLDRVTGQPLYPIRMRRAPTSKLPGEKTAPYQPDIELPQPFARQFFHTNDLTTRSSEAQEYIRQRVAGANHGWFQPFEEGKPTVLYNIHGGAEWTGAAFDPRSGHLFVSANEIPWMLTVFQDDPEPPRDPANPTAGELVYQKNCANCHGPDRIGVGTAPPLRGLRQRLKDSDVLALLQTGRNLMPAATGLTEAERAELIRFLFLRDRTSPPTSGRPAMPTYTHNGYPKLLDLENYPGNKPPWGTLNCIDLNTGQLKWKVPLGEYPELTAQGIPKTGTENFGGAMVTAGNLVFCSGTRDRRIRAFDTDTGRELWSHELPLHGTAPPATYSAQGRQYIVIAATGGGKLGGPAGDIWVAFSLP